MFSGYERISRATTQAIANALRDQKGIAIASGSGKRTVAWAAAVCWPELHGWTREGVLRAAAERLGVAISYRGGVHVADGPVGGMRTSRGDVV